VAATFAAFCRTADMEADPPNRTFSGGKDPVAAEPWFPGRIVPLLPILAMARKNTPRSKDDAPGFPILSMRTANFLARIFAPAPH